jgi:hypothetical protein
LEYKTCTKCGETKSATREFWYFRHDKPVSQCKQCRIRGEMERYWADPPRARERKRVLAAARADELRQYDRDQYWLNREQHQRIARESRTRNLEKARKRDNTKGARVYAAGRETLDEWYSSGCVVCAQYIPGAMHAHHRDPLEKHACVSQLCRQPKRLADELEKCDPLCGNHHGMLERRLRNGDRDRPYADVLAEMRAEWAAYVKQLVA